MKIVVTVAMILLVANSAKAQLAGAQCEGSYHTYGNPALNHFDPANGGVPAESSGIQPSAIVADPDGSYSSEFMMRYGDHGCDVDIDDTTITVTWYSSAGETMFQSALVRIHDFDVLIEGVTVVESFPGVTVTSGDDWVQIDSSYLVTAGPGSPLVVTLELQQAVPVERATWSSFKARFH